jgi:hypothetical protein
VINLFAQPEGVYRVAIDPLSYLQVGHFVSVLSSGQTRLTVTFPVDPAKVRAVVFPAYDDLSEESKRLLSASDNVLGFEGQFGADFFNRLDDIRRAGLMNIVAQCANTVFASARSVLSFLNRLIEVRGDRFFHRSRGRCARKSRTLSTRDCSKKSQNCCTIRQRSSSTREASRRWTPTGISRCHFSRRVKNGWPTSISTMLPASDTYVR